MSRIASGAGLKIHTLAIIWAGCCLLTSACNFTLAFNSTPAVRLSPTPAAEHTPATVPAPNPGPPAIFQAIDQQQFSQLTTAGSPPVPLESQLPAPIPREDQTGEQYRSGFACTGSMRPTIDCGDEGVFSKPPFQEPLMVGDVISFSSDLSCRYYKNQNTSKAHRITSIRTEGGVDYYTTRGDAANNADLCETTIDQIDGKLVEIRKDVRPQDVIDTTEYDLAKEFVNHLKDQYDELKTQFDQAKAAYDDRGEEYQEMVTSYSDGRAEYQDVLEFHQQLETERVALNRQKDRINHLAGEINSGIKEVDRLYLELFAQ